MKDRLVFDVTDTDTIADSDSIGAYLRSSDGTLIDHETINSVDRLSVDSTLKDGAGTALTSTLVSGKQALDVNVAQGINVEVDLSHVDDSVRLGDGTSFFTSTSENGDIALDVHLSNSNIEVTQGTSPWVIGDGGGSITVDAVDLDIRDLSASQDNVAISDGVDTMAVNGDGSINAVVTATQLDIDDLNATDDAVASWTHDGTGTAITSTGGALDINQTNDVALANTAIDSGATSLTTGDTAQDVVASPLANRKYLYLYNNDNRTMYIGESGVSASTGFPVSPSSYMELRAGASLDIEFVSGKTGHDLRFLQLS